MLPNLRLPIWDERGCLSASDAADWPGEHSSRIVGLFSDLKCPSQDRWFLKRLEAQDRSGSFRRGWPRMAEDGRA